MKIVFAPLEEAGKFVRLILGLSTGAVVLFANLLASSQSPRWLRGILAASLVAFGLAAVTCLLILLRLLFVRILYAKAITDATFKPQLDPDVETVTSAAVWLIWFLAGGILLAASFVVASVLAH